MGPGIFSFRFVLNIVCILTCVNCEVLPDVEVFAEWAKNLEKNMLTSITKITKLDVGKQGYENLEDVEIITVNGAKVVEEVVEIASNLLKKKEEALERLAATVREAEEKHEEDLTLTLQRVPFFNVKGDEAEEPGRLDYNLAFKQNVTFDVSGVHIPLEIYEGWMGSLFKLVWGDDPEILNGLKWSAALDKSFIANMEEDPTLRWQYFGSSRGYMRIYPALQWPENLNPPDLFDVRRRPWYIRSIASPKDVVVLIDKSGSVHGQTIDIMKIAVKALIRTLSEDDYFNVAWFNNDVNWVIPCLDTLIPATSQNKRVLLDAVDRLQESNLTSYETALQFAFEALQKFSESREPWEGSECHKSIMFFSDGGTDWPQELNSHLCNGSETECIRVFTFGCGPHPIPTVILKSMACKTRGYFSSITAIGAVQSRIQDYVRILGRPLVLTEGATQKMFHWNNIYIDKGGLGPVVSVTLPVSGSSFDAHDPLLLGVLGTDVPTKELENLFPFHILGSLGYPFAINTNGFVVFHPQLQYHISYLQGEDPPNIDLMEAEGTDSVQMEKIREAMVTGQQGQLVHGPALVPVGIGRSLFTSFQFYYQAMTTSPFRLGLALPTGHTVLNVQGPALNPDRLKELLSIPGSLLAPWRFCSDFLHELDSVQSREALLTAVKENPQKCNAGMLRHLLLDLERTRTLTLDWERSETEFSGVLSRFISTEGGLTTVRPVSRVADYENTRDPHKNQKYRRTVSRETCVLTPNQMHDDDDLKSSTVSLTCPIQTEINDAIVNIGVIGAEVEQPAIQIIFDETLKPNCTDGYLHCYLIDDNGFIVASNQLLVLAGSFIGQIDPQLAEELVASGLFHQQDRFNLQAWCLRGASEPVQSAASLPTPMTSFVSNLATAISAINYFIYGFFAMLWPKPTEAFFGWELIKRNYSCITKTTWLVKSSSISPLLDRRLHCGDCSRMMHATPLQGLSSILIVAQPPCDCILPPMPIYVSPQEDIGPDYCARQNLIRKPTRSCYKYSKSENESSCFAGDISSGSSLKSILGIFYIIMPVVWLEVNL